MFFCFCHASVLVLAFGLPGLNNSPCLDPNFNLGPDFCSGFRPSTANELATDSDSAIEIASALALASTYHSTGFSPVSASDFNPSLDFRIIFILGSWHLHRLWPSPWLKPLLQNRLLLCTQALALSSVLSIASATISALHLL